MEQIIQNNSYLNGLSDIFKRILVNLSGESPRFTQWFRNNHSKIISKFRGARDIEDQHDVLTELRCAAFLLSFDVVTDIIYEPFHQVQQSPDFKAVLSDSSEIYFEVRRIRKNLAEVKRDQFESKFWEKVRTNIHRNFGLSLMIDSIESADVFQSLIDRLDEIITFIDIQLSKLPEDMDDPIELSLDIFADELKIGVSSVPLERRQFNEIRNYGGTFTIPYSGNEYRKFGDIIFEKTHQLLDGESNIIFVFADNDTHEAYDLIDSIASINDLIRGSNVSIIQGKGYVTIEDFLVKSKRISGILLLTKDKDRLLWINQGSEHPVKEELKAIFEGDS